MVVCNRIGRTCSRRKDSAKYCLVTNLPEYVTHIARNDDAWPTRIVRADREADARLYTSDVQLTKGRAPQTRPTANRYHVARLNLSGADGHPASHQCRDPGYRA